MTLKHIVTDLHKVYLTEMEAKIKPKSTAGTEKKASGDSEGGTAEDQVKKAARQLAYDTRYKARRDGLPLERAFTQTLQNSSASGPVKELAKGMLFGGGQKEEVEKISEKPELPPEIFDALRRLENKRQRQGGDKKDSPFPSDKKEKDVKKESIGTAIDKTLGAAGEVADTAIKLPVKAVGYVAGLKKGLKKQFKKGQNKANEHHEKDADGKVLEHDVEDTAPSSIDEAKTKAKTAGKKGKKKDKVLVTPVKGQGKQYRRYADAKKKYELRKNPQISSVTGTSYGSTYDEKPEDKKNPGKFPQQKKAKKDFDGDGKLESPKKEWKGSKDKAIKKAIKKQKNEEFSNWKEEFDLTEIIKKDSQPKKIQELKGKNTIIINPKLEEGIETLGGCVLGVDELTNEEIANIDELKSTTLSNYITKAAADSVKHASSSGMSAAYDGVDSKKATKKRDKAWKRATGIRRAGNRLANRAIRGGQEDSTKKMEWEEVQNEELHPNIKKIDAASKANVAKQAAKAKEDRSAREKTAAAFQAHKKSVLAKGGRPVDALDSWHKKKANEAVDPKGGGSSPDLSVKQQNTERKQTESQREKIRKQRELIARMRQQDVSQGRQPTGHTARESVIIGNDNVKEDSLDERLGGKGYSRKAAASSVYPGKKSTGDWPDSDRGEGNKAARRAGKPVKAKSPTYIAYVKNKKANEALDLKKDDAGSAPADKKAEGMNKQIERKEKKVAVMKRQILQKKVQAVRAGAGGDVVAHFEPEGQVLEGKKKDDTYDEPNWEKRKANNEKARKDLMKGPQMKNPHLEAYRVLAKSDKDNKPSRFSYQDEKTAKKFADSIKKGGGRATVSKEETVVELNRYEKEKGTNTKDGKPTSSGGTKKPSGNNPKDAALDHVLKSIRAKHGKGAIMRSGSKQQKKVKGQKDDRGTGKYKKAADAKKQTAADAKKRGFKDTQNYVDTMARYGGKDNYDKGRGLGT